MEESKKVKKQMSLEECIIYYNNVIKAWANKCYESAKKLSHNIMDADDFYSEAMICLMKVYEIYQPYNTFTTTLFKSLDNLKTDIFRLLNCKKRKTEERIISLDETIQTAENSADRGNKKLFHKNRLKYEDTNLKDIEIRNDINNVIKKLNIEERTIFNFLLNRDITKKVLSKKLNMSRPTLDSRIPKVQGKIRNLLPEYVLN